MARFDVYRDKYGSGLLLDCQADVLSGLNTRFVIPLMSPGEAPTAGRRLNPSFGIGGETFVMVTQFAASIDTRLLGERVDTLAGEHAVVMNAIDMLATGY